MMFEELLKQRRSIRKYKDMPVPIDMVHQILRECTFAPNAGNEQPWKFIIVHNKEMIKRISDESKKNILNRIIANPNDYAKKYQKRLENPNFNVFYNAPCLVMVLGRTNLKNLFVDCALAASYIMLSAVSRGLGTCWVNLGTDIKDREMRDELGFPDDCTIVAPITLGYPEHIPSSPKRNDPVILKTIA
jgi:nitroreductase